MRLRVAERTFWATLLFCCLGVGTLIGAPRYVVNAPVDMRDGVVTGAKIRDLTIQNADIANATIQTGKLATAASSVQDGYLTATDWNTFNSKLSSYTETDPNALHLTGGTMTGTINSRSVIPTADNTYDLGSSSNRFANAYGINFGSPGNFRYLQVDDAGNTVNLNNGAASGTVKILANGTGGVLRLESTAEPEIAFPTSTTVGAAGVASALPANPAGYISIKIGASSFKIPYYNP